MKKRGSILIWSMLLSFFVIAFFIWAQSSFKKFSIFSDYFNDKIKIQSDLDDAISSLKWNPKSYIVSDDYNINSLDFDWSYFSGFLASNENKIYQITDSWWDLSINLNPVSPWILNYKLIYFDSGSLSNSWSLTWSLTSSSWINLKFDAPYNFNILILSSSWNYTQYSLSRWNTDLIPQNNLYKLIEKIWDYDKFIKNFEVENFDINSYSGIISNFN